MTAIIAVAVNPAAGEKPYFLIASESMRVTKEVDEHGQFQTVSVENDFKKIHKINKRVIGVSGITDDWFTEKFVSQLEESDLEFKSFCKLAFDLVKDYIKNNTLLDIARCNVVIGERNDFTSSIAHFLIIKGSEEESELYIASPGRDNALPINIGNVKGMEDLFNNFLGKVRNAVNLNSYVIKKAAKEYIEAVASRVPEDCNKNIAIIKL